MNDPYNLRRFLDAQNSVFDEVRAQLQKGRKTSHWMWFIFPQIQGLGHSAMARRYAIGSLEEAKAYLAHETLGSRLKECTRLVTFIHGRSVQQIFGSPDDLKFRSSMTLFAQATLDNNVFIEALNKYWRGEFDQFTIEHLNSLTLLRSHRHYPTGSSDPGKNGSKPPARGDETNCEPKQSSKYPG